MSTWIQPKSRMYLKNIYTLKHYITVYTARITTTIVYVFIDFENASENIHRDTLRNSQDIEFAVK